MIIPVFGPVQKVCVRISLMLFTSLTPKQNLIIVQPKFVNSKIRHQGTKFFVFKLPWKTPEIDETQNIIFICKRFSLKKVLSWNF